MKKPIAMRCTEQQFNLIKKQLSNTGIEISEMSTFCDRMCYLTNNFRGKHGVVSNIGRSDAEDTFRGREVHETWNEKAFLEACGIDCEPEYKITKTQIKELHDKGVVEMKQWYPEVVGVELVVGEWYSDRKFGLLINIEEVKDNGLLGYGFGCTNEWHRGEFCTSFESGLIHTKNLEPATEKEVFEALKGEAVKIGYKKGDYCEKIHKQSDDFIQGNANYVLSNDNRLWFGGVVVFKDGQWATIIPTITKAEAEKQLNKKIV